MISNAGFANISHNKNSLLRKTRYSLKATQFLLQYWPSRSFKVNDFHVVWKPLCDFLLVINSNLGHVIYHRFRDMATYSFKHSIPNRCRWTHGYYMTA